MCVHASLYVSILLCVCAHALQVCVHMEAKRQYQVFFKCYLPLCLRQSPTDLELVVQRTPGAHLSLAPWNYKHVPPHPAFLCGLWGSNSGSHACGINILFFSKLSKPQLHKLLRWNIQTLQHTYTYQVNPVYIMGRMYSRLAVNVAQHGMWSIMRLFFCTWCLSTKPLVDTVSQCEKAGHACLI